MSSEETGGNSVDCSSRMGEIAQEKENGKQLKKSVGEKIRRQTVNMCTSTALKEQVIKQNKDIKKTLERHKNLKEKYKYERDYGKYKSS